MEVPVIEICIATNTNTSISVTVDGEPYEISAPHGFIPARDNNVLSYIYPLNTTLGLSLSYTGSDIGTDYPISTLSLNLDGIILEGGSRFGNGTSGVVSITEQTDQKIVGSFSGDFLDKTTNEEVSVSGTFTIE
ncbi:MAG: hypothetical protein AAF242_20725 [Bacteroidota bacterium]